MIRRKLAVTIAIGAVVGGLGLTGGAEAARCGSRPDFEPGGFTNSTGEAVVLNDPTAKTDGTHPFQPGQTTILFCQGAPVAD